MKTFEWNLVRFVAMNKSKITGVILSSLLLSFWGCEDSSTGNSEDQELPTSSSIAAISSSSEAEISSAEMSSSEDEGTSFSVVKRSSSSIFVALSSSQLLDPESSSSSQTAEVDPAILGNWIQVDMPSGETARTLEITTEHYNSGNGGMFVGTNNWSTFFAHDGFIGIISDGFGATNWVAYTLSKDTLYVVEGGTKALPGTTVVILDDPATLKFYPVE